MKPEEKSLGLSFQASNTEHGFAELFHLTICRKDQKCITVSDVKQLN